MYCDKWIPQLAESKGPWATPWGLSTHHVVYQLCSTLTEVLCMIQFKGWGTLLWSNCKPSSVELKPTFEKWEALCDLVWSLVIGWSSSSVILFSASKSHLVEPKLIGCRGVAAGFSLTYIFCISLFGFQKDPYCRKKWDDQKGTDVWMQGAALHRKT